MKTVTFLMFLMLCALTVGCGGSDVTDDVGQGGEAGMPVIPGTGGAPVIVGGMGGDASGGTVAVGGAGGIVEMGGAMAGTGGQVQAGGTGGTAHLGGMGGTVAQGGAAGSASTGGMGGTGGQPPHNPDAPYAWQGCDAAFSDSIAYDIKPDQCLRVTGNVTWRMASWTCEQGGARFNGCGIITTQVIGWNGKPMPGPSDTYMYRKQFEDTVFTVERGTIVDGKCSLRCQ